MPIPIKLKNFYLLYLAAKCALMEREVSPRLKNNAIFRSISSPDLNQSFQPSDKGNRIYTGFLNNLPQESET